MNCSKRLVPFRHGPGSFDGGGERIRWYSYLSRLTLGFNTRTRTDFWRTNRGLSIHRYYLEQFLQEFSTDIRGRCLEFQGDAYASRFGKTTISRLDILHRDAGNPRATIVADLTKPNTVPSEAFDCIICTFVLQLIPEFGEAVSQLYRILSPGGVLLIAVPHISMYDAHYHDHWRFTPEGLSFVLEKAFGIGNVIVRSFGNSLVAAAEIRGMTASELTRNELDYNDPRFAVEVCGRAVKHARTKD